MSVGDVLVVGETAYACESFGWRRLTPDEFGAGSAQVGKNARSLADMWRDPNLINTDAIDDIPEDVLGRLLDL